MYTIVSEKLTVQPAVGLKEKVRFIKNHADFGIVFKLVIHAYALVTQQFIDIHIVLHYRESIKMKNYLK